MEATWGSLSDCKCLEAAAVPNLPSQTRHYLLLIPNHTNGRVVTAWSSPQTKTDICQQSDCLLGLESTGAPSSSFSRHRRRGQDSSRALPAPGQVRGHLDPPSSYRITPDGGPGSILHKSAQKCKMAAHQQRRTAFDRLTKPHHTGSDYAGALRNIYN